MGGRYSALSNFGLVPAALLGASPVTLLDRAREMAERCASDGPENSALELGVVLGELALAGRDKPTLIAPSGIASFGAWLEQLVADLSQGGKEHSVEGSERLAGHHVRSSGRLSQIVPGCALEAPSGNCSVRSSCFSHEWPIAIRSGGILPLELRPRRGACLREPFESPVSKPQSSAAWLRSTDRERCGMILC